jgi:hypothetical protein
VVKGNILKKSPKILLQASFFGLFFLMVMAWGLPQSCWAMRPGDFCQSGEPETFEIVWPKKIKQEPQEEVLLPQASLGECLVAPNKNSVSPLAEAAKTGQLAVCWKLLRGNEQRGLALELASENGHLAVCRLFLQPGVTPVFETDTAEVLQRIAKNGHWEVLVLLLSAGVQASQASARALLIESASKGHLKLCRLLLSQGVDNFWADTKALDRGIKQVGATQPEHRSEVSKLFAYAGDYFLIVCGYTEALQQAAENGHANVCKLLLEHNGPFFSCDFVRELSLGKSPEVQRVLLRWLNRDEPSSCCTIS